MPFRLIAFALALIASLDLGARPRPSRVGGADTPAEWLHRYAFVLRTIEPVTDDADLFPLLSITSGVRFIALGDATHGTHEFFASKLRLIPFFIRYHGVRAIAIEAPYAEWQAVRNYVRSGTGDPGAAIRSTDYFFWNTAEMLALIEWVRLWNSDGRNEPVDIVGFDGTHPEAIVPLVVDALREVDATAADQAAQLYACVGGLAPALCAASITPARALIESQRAAFVAKGSLEEYEDTLHAARVIEQGLEGLANANFNRDHSMAENADWLSRRYAAPIVLWAHNEHLSESPYILRDSNGTASVGSLLVQQHGDAYVSIGSMAYGGTYNAMEFTGQGVWRVGSYAMTPPSADDYAAFFRQASIPLMIVPLRRNPPSWLSAAHRFRVGTTNIQSAARTMLEVTEPLTRKFDALLWVETSTPTTLRQ